MKTKLLTLFSLLVLLLVSTAVLADGRPTGIRIGRAANGGDSNVEIDVTVTGTNVPWNTFSSTVSLGNRWASSYPGYGYGLGWQYASSQLNVPFPYAIDWGDGSRQQFATLLGSPGSGWVGTFSHTYSPGSYVIAVGDSIQGRSAGNYGTGNLVTGSARYLGYNVYGTFVIGSVWTTSPSPLSWNSYILALTANTTVTTGTGIPTMNIYGLLALSLVLVGTGILLYRKPQRTVA